MCYEIKVEEKIIVYLDILGYKEILNDKTKVQEIKEIISFGKSLLKQFETHHEKMKRKKDAQFDFKIISDGILLAIDKDYDFLGIFLYIVSFVQDYFLLTGLLTRGAITIGDYYFDGEILFSKGFVDAYNKEEKEAIYPRVILTKEFLRYVVDFYKDVRIINQSLEEIYNKYQYYPEIHKLDIILNHLDWLEEHNRKFNSQYSEEISFIVSYFNKTKAKSKKITVSWHRKEILYDIECLKQLCELEKAPIIQDIDGYFYIDYLNYIITASDSQYIEKLKERLNNRKSQFKDKERIASKYFWLEHYFNRKLLLNGENLTVHDGKYEFVSLISQYKSGELD